ncbi:MAG: tetratricopeptide repeat protein, partial [Bacteroidetes bacterium]
KYRRKVLDILEAQMKLSDEIRIKYAAKHARISNYYKKWIGENRGLKKLNAVEVKKQQEADFLQKINANPEWKEKYGNVIPELKRLYAEIEPLAFSREMFIELAYYGPEIFRYAFTFRSLVKEATSSYVNMQLIEKEKKKVLDYLPRFKKDFDKETDIKLFESIMPEYASVLPEEGKAPMLRLYNDLYKGDWSKGVSKFYASVLLDFDNIENIIKNFGSKYAKKIEKDLLFKFTDDLYTHYYKVVKPKYDQLQQEINKNMRLYLEALQKVYPEKRFYPDANGTLRLSYGKIEGYSPADGVYYDFYTTMDGMMEKYDPSVEEFNLPQKLIDLYNAKDYGIYATKGEMRVCFIASNHTTGGNSGSPVLDAEGNLIGLNFDRTWESTMSDIMYDPERCRNIAMDMNYLLFILDKYAGMQRLIDEMNVISKVQTLYEEINRLEEKLKTQPDNADLYNEIGLKYFELGELTKAEEYFVKAMEINPQNPKYCYNAGTLMAMQNKLPEAVDYFTKTIKLNDKYTDAYYNRGKAYADLSKFEEAIQDFTTVIQLKPDYAAAYNNRGVAKNIFLEDKSGCEDI